MRWQLPPWRGWQYLASDLLADGAELIYADLDPATDTALAAFEALRAQYQAH